MKKYLILIAIICACDLLFLWWMDSYLGTRGEITIQPSLSANQIDLVPNLPIGASAIHVSPNGRFAAYLIDNVIEIRDIPSKGNAGRISLEGTFDMFQWVPDRDSLLFTVKQNDATTGREDIVLSRFDVDNQTTTELQTIADLDPDTHTSQITLSLFTHTIYLKLNSEIAGIWIYRIDIMNKIKRCTTGIEKIGRVETLSLKDTLIVENEKTHSISAFSGGMRNEVPTQVPVSLLGVDENDRLIIGRLDRGQIIDIEIMTLDGHIEQRIPLSRGALPEEFTTTPDAHIYWLNSPNQIVILPENRSLPTDGAIRLESLSNERAAVIGNQRIDILDCAQKQPVS